MAKCQRCIFGAVDNNGQYNFSVITKKINNQIITLYYNRNDCGCRMSQWTEKEIECLNNNFSKFQSK
jgi:uncharacterized protein YmfQ (DUF2313 family)